MPIQKETFLETFFKAKRSETVAVLEGFHAVKHASRFGAKFHAIYCADRSHTLEIARKLAPDVLDLIAGSVVEIPAGTFSQLTDEPLHTGIIGIAGRPRIDAASILGKSGKAPKVVLENPSNLGNVGAVIRVAAAVAAGAVITTGTHDPWHPAALRGATGLHFAIPVLRLAALERPAGPIYAVHPEGEALDRVEIPKDAFLVFGSERRGIAQATLAAATRQVAIPMEPGISSLNLATAVAVVLYRWRLRQSG